MLVKNLFVFRTMSCPNNQNNGNVLYQEFTLDDGPASSTSNVLNKNDEDDENNFFQSNYDSDQGYHSKSSSEASIENDKNGSMNSSRANPNINGSSIQEDGGIILTSNLNPTTQVINNNARLSGNEQEGQILTIQGSKGEDDDQIDQQQNQNFQIEEENDEGELSPSFFGSGHRQSNNNNNFQRYSEYSLDDGSGQQIPSNLKYSQGSGNPIQSQEDEIMGLGGRINFWRDFEDTCYFGSVNMSLMFKKIKSNF